MTNRIRSSSSDFEIEEEWPFPAAHRRASEPLATACQGLMREVATDQPDDLEARVGKSVSASLGGLLHQLDRRLDGIDAEIVRGRAEMRSEYAAVKEGIRQLRAAIDRQESSHHLLLEAVQRRRPSGRMKARSLADRRGR